MDSIVYQKFFTETKFQDIKKRTESFDTRKYDVSESEKIDVLPSYYLSRRALDLKNLQGNKPKCLTCEEVIGNYQLKVTTMCHVEVPSRDVDTNTMKAFCMKRKCITAGQIKRRGSIITPLEKFENYFNSTHSLRKLRLTQE